VLYQSAKFGTKKYTCFRVIAVCVLGYFYGAPCSWYRLFNAKFIRWDNNNWIQQKAGTVINMLPICQLQLLLKYYCC